MRISRLAAASTLLGILILTLSAHPAAAQGSGVVPTGGSSAIRVGHIEGPSVAPLAASSTPLLRRDFARAMIQLRAWWMRSVEWAQPFTEFGFVFERRRMITWAG
jgi:hypothetical protein